MMHRLAALAIAAPLLLAFAPPDAVTRPGLTIQQTPPNGWIPERKDEPQRFQEPDQYITTLRAPATVACPAPDSGPQKASQRFVENYLAAKNALMGRNWQTALDAVNEAAKEAADARQWAALESVRVQAYFGQGDKLSQLTSLEALEKLSCDRPGQNADSIARLRNELGLAPR